jgi:pimeloyl-ACP methyl ester carboxylesterase
MTAPHTQALFELGPMSSEQTTSQSGQYPHKGAHMTEPTTHTIDVPGATLTYDVHVPDAPSDERPLFVFGSPMGASGFEQLVGHLADRTVITYDPRGMERSTRVPGTQVTVEVHAEDYHRVVEAVGLGSVDAFGSSGGGMCGLHWVVAHPEDVRTFVSHEPPVLTLLEDSQMAMKVNADIVDTYQRDGFGPAMAKFIQLVMYQGLLPDDYLDRHAPDPAQFGLPTEDDGSRDDLLLSGNLATPPFEPDAEALRRSSVRVVPAVGALGAGGLARRGGEAVARLLGVEPVVFPGDHGGFAANEWSPDNDPAAFAAKLREVLVDD